MPPREPQLPEGTDHIVNGALETRRTAGTGSRGRGSKGFVASGEGDGTGGTATTEGGRMAKVISEQTATLKRQATDRVRQFAEDGKTRASDALDEVARAVEEAAAAIEDRLGEQYGSYARRAADRVSGIATTLRERDVDDLYDDARDLVRANPLVTIGATAAIGFALVRLIRAGMPEDDAEADRPAPRGRKKSR